MAHALSAQRKAMLVDEPTLQGLSDGIIKATNLLPAIRGRGNLAEAIFDILDNRCR
jgi:hypothetical protein